MPGALQVPAAEAQPPSAVITVPLISAASLEIRNSSTAAASSAVPTRPRGFLAPIFSRIPGNLTSAGPQICSDSYNNNNSNNKWVQQQHTAWILVKHHHSLLRCHYYCPCLLSFAAAERNAAERNATERVATKRNATESRHGEYASTQLSGN